MMMVSEDELRAAISCLVAVARAQWMPWTEQAQTAADLLEQHAADLAAGPALRERVAALEGAAAYAADRLERYFDGQPTSSLDLHAIMETLRRAAALPEAGGE